MTVPDFPFDDALWKRHAVLTSAEMREAERTACALGATTLATLMQKAGEAVAREITARWHPCRVLVLCGPGNNGGDGYVVAEALRWARWGEVRVAAMPMGAPSPEAAKARQNWGGAVLPLEDAPFDDADLVVDALFGTGLSRPPEGVAAAALRALNARRVPVIAVDIPSGVNADTGAAPGEAARADLTVTFFRRKRGHFLQPGASLSGEVALDPIGIMDEALDNEACATAANEPGLWGSFLRPPGPADHKYTRGAALLFGGPVMTGAARLAARAAQRTGAGLVTLATRRDSMPLYAAALESVIVREAETPAAWEELAQAPKLRALLIGPGMGVDEDGAARVLVALKTGLPCVLDADALTVFAANPERLFAALHPACVLTPHEGEFTRLFGPQDGTERLGRAQEAARRAGAIVALKGSPTLIAHPSGRVLMNAHAPAWLATAGAGDVLAGMILGLLANGLPPLAATAAAVWLHGDAAARHGPGLIAEDVVDRIPEALAGFYLAQADTGKGT